MKELLRGADPVALSWISALLADSGIDCEIFDLHTSTFLGALGIQRRLMVADEDHARAQRLLDEARQAGHWL